MRFLTLGEVLAIHLDVVRSTGGHSGVRDLSTLESCLAQPRQTFGGSDLYPTVTEKAAVLGFSIIANHPFIDGNKRTGHAAMEVFLLLNDLEIGADVEEQERVILTLASGEMDRIAFACWLAGNVRATKEPTS